jgi:2-haloalkanoic acid dehalogenase type II
MASLTDFKVLSFDCYGTLIDWEAGVFQQLQSLLSRVSANHPFQNQHIVISRFNEHQGGLEREQPKLPYNEVLSRCFARLAEELGVHVTETETTAFGQAVGEWKAFPDTVAGLHILKKYYKLIILSNVDRYNLQNTLAGPLPIEFDDLLIAQDIGSYKPNHRNFQYLFDTLEQKFNLSKSDLLHTAKSLPVDHVPAKELGIASAWIARGDDGVSAMGGNLKDLQDKVAFTWRFTSIGEMAEEVERAFLAKQESEPIQ